MRGTIEKSSTERKTAARKLDFGRNGYFCKVRNLHHLQEIIHDLKSFALQKGTCLAQLVQDMRTKLG